MPVIIGITGGSCSGKTTLAKAISEYLSKQNCLLITQDNYYHDMKKLSKQGELPNFDAPEAVDYVLLEHHIEQLKSNTSVDAPLYHFPTHSRRLETQVLEPKPFIVIEGMLLLADPRIRKHLDFSYYIRCDEAKRYKRRLERDIRDRGRTPESVKVQFENFVKPSHEAFVKPTQTHVTEVISQDEYVNNRDQLIARLVSSWMSE